MRKTHDLHIRVEPEVMEAIRKAAEADDRTPSDWLRRLIRKALETPKRKKPW